MCLLFLVLCQFFGADDVCMYMMYIQTLHTDILVLRNDTYCSTLRNVGFDEIFLVTMLVRVGHSVMRTKPRRSGQFRS